MEGQSLSLKDRLRSMVDKTKKVIEKNYDIIEKERRYVEQTYVDSFTKSCDLKNLENEFTKTQRLEWASKNYSKSSSQHEIQYLFATFYNQKTSFFGRLEQSCELNNPDNQGKKEVADKFSRGFFGNDTKKYFDELSSFDRCKIVEYNLNHMIVNQYKENQESSEKKEYFRCHIPDRGDYVISDDTMLSFVIGM